MPACPLPDCMLSKMRLFSISMNSELEKLRAVAGASWMELPLITVYAEPETATRPPAMSKPSIVTLFASIENDQSDQLGGVIVASPGVSDRMVSCPSSPVSARLPRQMKTAST